MWSTDSSVADVSSAPQVPGPGEINVDHLAHFVPDIDAATRALEALGFAPTPFSAQFHRLQPDGPLVPAGTGNRCVMLGRGYLEFLTPTGDTPVAAQLRRAIARHTGVHLVAFGTSDAENDHSRLVREGFSPLDPIALQRPIPTESGESTARFTVVRVAPGTMAEGRIQFCQHHTPELVWQARWLAHPNGAAGLAAVLVCVHDPEEAGRRYARFTGLDPESESEAWHLRSARGSVTFVGADAARERLGVEPPSLPWIAGAVLETCDLARTRAHLEASGAQPQSIAGGVELVRLPPELGGILIFQERGARFGLGPALA